MRRRTAKEECTEGCEKNVSLQRNFLTSFDQSVRCCNFYETRQCWYDKAQPRGYPKQYNLYSKTFYRIFSSKTCIAKNQSCERTEYLLYMELALASGFKVPK